MSTAQFNFSLFMPLESWIARDIFPCTGMAGWRCELWSLHCGTRVHEVDWCDYMPDYVFMCFARWRNNSKTISNIVDAWEDTSGHATEGHTRSHDICQLVMNKQTSDCFFRSVVSGGQLVVYSRFWMWLNQTHWSFYDTYGRLWPWHNIYLNSLHKHRRSEDQLISYDI